MPPNSKSAHLKKIKTGILSRGLTMAKLTVHAGTGYAVQKMTGILKNPEQKKIAWQDFLKTQATQFSNEVGELKGSLMKAGQMLSIYGEYFFTPEINSILKTLQNDSPPVQWNRIEQILRTQLPEEILNELEIEKESLAGASLGQVHRARIKSTSETIVLKIQYPGVERAIDSDLKALKNFLVLMKVFPMEEPLDELLIEMRDMLKQEVDYRREVELMEEYREALKDDSRFIVPQVYNRYCSDKVIAMSFERGLRADDPLIQSLSLDRRNRLASHFLDLFFKELFEWRLVQTDPHLGNYRLRLDPAGHDKIVLLDFGATRNFNEKFVTAYAHMIRGSMEKTSEFEKASLELGVLKENDDTQLISLFRSMCEQIVEPFAPGFYDWKNTPLPHKIMDIGFQILREYPMRSPPREMLFLNRKTAGVFIFLSVLGARIESRTTLTKYLSQIPK